MTKAEISQSFLSLSSNVSTLETCCNQIKPLKMHLIVHVKSINIIIHNIKQMNNNYRVRLLDHVQSKVILGCTVFAPRPCWF